MKKQLFAFALVASVLCLNSCEKKVNPDPEPETDVKITVTPHEVQLSDEEQSIRLSASLEPADPTATITWTSSDTTIATVTNRGIVEATGYGECYIYASVGKAKDSCHVKVVTYFESLLFNGAFLWDVDSTYALDPETGEYKVETIKASDGTEYRVYKALATMFLFSDGFYINNNFEFDGLEKGTIIEMYAPIYYSTNYLSGGQGGTVFSLGEWAITDQEFEDDTHVGKPGKLDEAEYIEQMKGFIECVNTGSQSYPQYLKAAGEAYDGCTVAVLEYDAEDETYYNSHIPDGACEYAYFDLEGRGTAASNYMYIVDFMEVTFKNLAEDDVFGWNIGLNLDWDQETDIVSFVDEEVHFDPSITTVFGEVPSGKSAKKTTPVSAIIPNAEQKAKLMQQIKDKDIRVIRMKH